MYYQLDIKIPLYVSVSQTVVYRKQKPPRSSKASEKNPYAGWVCELAFVLHDTYNGNMAFNSEPLKYIH